ncbi:MAG: NADH-quinone oxidoreductase subunit M [Bacteroidota bacterium]|nr:NADH-quinone oxidoreductase subunit M [Bacteroidota bacterium]
MNALFLIVIPFIASGLILLFRKSIIVKCISIAASLIQLLLTLYVLIQTNFSQGNILSFFIEWIPSLGINFSLNVDGISMFMLVLTNFLSLLILVSGINREPKRIGMFYSMIFFTQAAMNGVFLSSNAILFYIFWELSLIPVYFMVLFWGGERRQAITLKFFIYTLLGSLFMLFAFIFLYWQTSGIHSFEITDFYKIKISPAVQNRLFWCLFIAFAIKIPLFPFHSWQPDTYTTAPTQVTMILSGIMLKMGIYGIIRWLLPIVPQGVEHWSNTVIILSITGALYASVIALKQNNIKTLLAWSSMAHVGIIGAGIFARNLYSLQGVMLQMLFHGINIIGLFLVADTIENRTGTRKISELGGIRNISPFFSSTFLIIILGSIALPLTNGFIGEFLILTGLFKYYSWYSIFAGLIVITGAVYMLYIYQKVMLGQTNELSDSFIKVPWAENIVLIPVIILIFLFGIYPIPLLNLTEISVKGLLQMM